jgi:hypothetical protein
MNNDNAKATDSATAEPRTATAHNPAIDHHLERLQAAAATENTEQRFPIAGGTLEEGEGQRLLIVQPDGSYETIFVPAGE